MKSINKFLVVMLCFVLFTTMAFALSACTEKELKITKIEVSGPSETAVGEFDYNDYTVKVIFDDGSTKDIKLNKDLLSASDRELLDTPGTHTITVKYNDVTCTFTVTIKGDGESQDKGIKSIAISGPNEIISGNIDYNDFSLVITYEDDSTTTIELREEFILEEDRAKLNTVGSHSISITYNGTTTTWNITVKENESTGDNIFEGVTFEDATYTYDGTSKSIKVNGVPDGATVKYNVSNSYTNAGVYPIEATISKEGYKTLVLTATLTINKATYDMSGVEFDDKTVVYNGEEQRIEISGSLPQGVTVSYENNDNTNVGTYEVIAKFTGDSNNYEAIADMTATLTIDKATYDMSGVEFVDKTVVYNGEVQRIEISGTLPQGVTVTYENNNNTDVGTYEVIAKFTGDSNNYEAIADMTATFIINKTTYDMSSIEFVDKTVVYNGEVQRIEISGSLPQGVTVSYENNGNINVGTYMVTAKFTGDSKNYKPIADMTATLTIKEAKETEGLIFEKINNDTEYSVVGYEGEDSDIVILSTHEGLPVTSIGDSAFSYCSGLTSITIPDSVTSIGDQAFYYCSGLTSVTIGNSVTSIGDLAFYYCSGLTIYCEVGSKPNAWNSSWNGDCPVVWDCNNNEIADDGYIYAIIDGLKYGLKDGEAYIAEQSRAISGNVVIKNSILYKGREYVVTSIGSYAFYGCSGLTSITIPDSVTSIGDCAFKYCNGLTSITIPDSVKSIGYRAFSDCSGLTSITVAEGNSKYHSQDNCIIETASKTLIAGCKTSIIPDDGSVTSIGWYAFEGCSGLTSITIPDSVTSIGSSAFWGCSGLTSITIPDSVTSIGNSAFHGCSGLTSITIPDSVTSIGDSAFEDCSGLTSITIPDSVTSIGDFAFSGCSGLTSITIPDSVTSIGDWAFAHCSGLTSIRIPDSVTSIGDQAFWDCSGLTSITIPDRVTSIGSYAFYNCSGLASITIPDSVTSIGSYAFYGCNGLTIYCEVGSKPDGWNSSWNASDCPVVWDCNNNEIADDGYIYAIIDGLKYGLKDGEAYIAEQSRAISGEVVIADKVSYKNQEYVVTKIGSSAFRSCNGLTSITIPDSVKSIGYRAFSDCSGLTSITVAEGNSKYHSQDNCIIETASKTLIAGCKTSIIPDDGSVTSIGWYAFEGCSGLTSITIPDSVTSIRDYAFA